MEHALEIKNFSKKYGATTAVDDISFTVAPGEFFGFLGPNGAGKSTTIHCITGIAHYEIGTIKVFGVDAREDYRKARTLVGLSPQEFNIDIFSPTKDILWLVGGYYGIPAPLRRERIDMLLKRFDLVSHARKPFMKLSGGLKRRVLLARAMIHDPKLLILDEPTAGVDVELRRELWKYLRELNAAGKTIVLTSHYLEEVEQLCSRIAIINKGKIVAIGNKEEFISGGRKLEDVYLEMTGSTSSPQAGSTSSPQAGSTSSSLEGRGSSRAPQAGSTPKTTSYAP